MQFVPVRVEGDRMEGVLAREATAKGMTPRSGRCGLCGGHVDAQLCDRESHCQYGCFSWH